MSGQLFKFKFAEDSASIQDIINNETISEIEVFIIRDGSEKKVARYQRSLDSLETRREGIYEVLREELTVSFVNYRILNATIFVLSSLSWRNFIYDTEFIMVGDADLVITEYHSLIDFVIRKCNTESKVLRQLFIIHTNSWKSHRSRELDRRILISDIAASFSYWVYIRESITDVPVQVK